MDWAFAAIGGLIGVGVVFVLLDVPITAEPARPPGGPALTVDWEGSRPEPAIAEEARLMDPSTLFLPSALTAATKTSPASGLAVAYSRLAWREAPELAFNATNLQLNLPPPMPVPTSPADALQVHPPGNPAFGLGRKDAAPIVLPARGGWMEVVNMMTGQVVISELIPKSDSPSDQANVVWLPDVYFVTVGEDGVLGDPVAAASATGTGYIRAAPRADQPSNSASGSSEPPASSASLSAGSHFSLLEEHPGDMLALEKQLDARLSFDHRLGAGFYRISVGP